MVYSLLHMYIEDLKALDCPKSLQYDFLNGPVKAFLINSRPYMWKAFTTFSQYQIVDKDTFFKVSRMKDDFNTIVCNNTYLVGAKRNWPSRFRQCEQEEDGPKQEKLKEGIIMDWLLQLKHTAFLINYANTLLTIKTPAYVIEAGIYVHASMYMGGGAFFQRRFDSFTPPSPEMVSSFRYLWPQTYLALGYEGNFKNFSDYRTVFKRAIRVLNCTSDQLAKDFDIVTYNFMSGEHDVTYARRQPSLDAAAIDVDGDGEARQDQEENQPDSDHFSIPHAILEANLKLPDPELGTKFKSLEKYINDNESEEEEEEEEVSKPSFKASLDISLNSKQQQQEKQEQEQEQQEQQEQEGKKALKDHDYCSGGDTSIGGLSLSCDEVLDFSRFSSANNSPVLSPMPPSPPTSPSSF